MENTEKSGQFFIAYKGQEYKKSDVYRALNRIRPSCYTIKCKTINDSIFAKIIYNNYTVNKDPHYNSREGILAVNGYNHNEVEIACRNLPGYGFDSFNMYQRITNNLYYAFRENMFKKLGQYMHFCSVIYDNKSGDIIAGVTKPDSKYTHLYYGYTKGNKEIMFSNDEDILQQFCKEVHEMDENTYMKNGELFTIDGDKVEKGKEPVSIKKTRQNADKIIDGDKTEKSKDPVLIEKTRQNADSIIDGLNALLVQVTDEVIRTKIEKNIEEYLSSGDPQQKVSSFILNELDTETRKQILQIIKNTLQEFSLEHEITDKLNELFDKNLSKYASRIDVPIVHVIKLKDTVLGQTEGGFYHEKFEQILSQVQLDEPIMLIGPAGSGKNVAISQVADALGQHMYYTNNASNEFKLTGFIDAGGNYRDTEFYKAFKNGGIFFLDEIDNSDPSALIVIISALANGYIAFPHETIDRHPDFRLIAAANTWGKGADLQYVGRNALDGATLDRFDNIFFDYDTNLEKALYPNDEVLQFMWAFRNAVYQSKIPHIVSTRGIGKVYKKEINGIPVKDTLTSNVVKNLGQDDVNTIIGNMQNISSDNKYYDGIKRLRLSR